MIRPSFSSMIQHIENELALSYGFRIEMSAADCLTQSAEAAAMAKAADNRATLLLRESPDHQELQLGIYFRPELMETLEAHNPMNRLDSANLDAFCVAVEEVSHFHLVVNRAQSQQGVSRLELEWQGEIDKWLLAGSFLEKQTGDLHLPQLTRLIFDGSFCYTSQDQNLYEEAHRLAARYCYKLLPALQDCLPSKRVRRLQEACRETYGLKWAAKVKTIEKL